MTELQTTVITLPRRPLPSRRTLVLGRRPSDERDTAFERDLFAESRDDLWLLPSDSRDVIVDMQFRSQRRGWHERYPDARHHTLLVNDVRAGHLVLAEDASTMVVVDLTVRAGLRGLGLGTTLLTDLTDTADATARSMRARVWGANCGAQRVFARFGFRAGSSTAGWHELFRPPAERAA